MYDTIPHDHTYVASDILYMLDCSRTCSGCHLLHSLCNHPFNKPLHPPGLRPSPFLSILWKRKGDLSNHIYVTLEPFSVRPAVSQLPPFNFVGKGSDARPPQVPPAVQFCRQGEPLKTPLSRALPASSPLYDLRFASVDKGSDAKDEE